MLQSYHFKTFRPVKLRKNANYSQGAGETDFQKFSGCLHIYWDHKDTSGLDGHRLLTFSTLGNYVRYKLDCHLSCGNTPS